ncbi:transglutaminase-like domain-containing protein [Catenuloplanes atrovinosus]|uniref:Transglutaminase-like putative cysteine protease n=1 Tax=Catenuloplanes atrovinosus TaxID=137266 RepID=A0AAE3YKQ5_9ACTN|nr:transglutaminase-like domain-containing protein [Catenuloplanes atrovinosus]MDR7273978.1 transglutaminase-like putative cysteine protease [Catenuloplanes atrovinosus]
MTSHPDGGSVACTLDYTVDSPTEFVFQIAVTTGGAVHADERLTVTVDDAEAEAETIPASHHGGRQHLVRATPGALRVRYTATVRRDAAPPRRVSAPARVQALRPSRYCPSDRMAGFAARRFGGTDAEIVRDVTEFVRGHLRYAPVSDSSTDAADTLLAGAGVCRDYAHLVTALVRASGVPARVAAVYAPGLAPMDFHLVSEVAVDGVWRIVDATGLAPRASMIRIATGRDAADVAFSTLLTGGRLTMTRMEVLAVADGDLPGDDPGEPVSLR